MAVFATILALVLMTIGGPTRNVEGKEIRDVVETFVQTALKESQERYTIEYRSMPTRLMNIPEHGRLQVVSNPGMKLRGSVLLPIEVFVDDRVEHTFLVSARIRTFGSVLTAAQTIEKNQSNESLVVTLTSGETTNLPVDVVCDQTSLKGKRSKKIIRRGEVLTRSMFESIPVVGPGKSVTLIVRASSVTIKTRAIVRESGGHGDIVSVQKDGRGDRLKARVVDENTVELLAQN